MYVREFLVGRRTRQGNVWEVVYHEAYFPVNVVDVTVGTVVDKEHADSAVRPSVLTGFRGATTQGRMFLFNGARSLDGVYSCVVPPPPRQR